MKKKPFIIVIYIILFSIISCTKTDSNTVIIEGTIINPIGESVTFSNQDTSFSTTSNINGTFSISFNLNSATNLIFEHGVESTNMYVYPGDRIILTLDTEEFDESIKYEGSPESSFLAKLYLIAEENDFLGESLYLKNIDEYNTILDTFQNKILKELNIIKDSSFINEQISALNENINYFIKRKKKLITYSEDVRLYMWETIEIGKQYDFYTAIDTLNKIEFNNMLDSYSKQFFVSLNKVSDSNFLEKAKTKIKKTIDNWSNRKEAYDKMPKEGEYAIDFSYTDKDSVEFSLSNFKGNLVYIDVWATWCGPCRAEIPSLKKLELEYHEKDITFLSVSVDNDRASWLEMIKEKELGGIQLWADGWSKITEDYAIFGIPRFMLISREGKIISNDAPRPSSDKIRTLLESNI
jgi:thiol-disulfide isomerase/thioredoxin